MNQYTLDDLKALLQDYAEQDELSDINLDVDIEEVPFSTLGYDSLALFNVICQVEVQTGVQLNYDQIASAKTPRVLLKMINEALVSEPNN